MPTIADQMITNGVTVLAIVNLDSDVGRGDRAEGQGSRASRRSTTTGSPWAARRTTTSPSTTPRSASCRARAWQKCLRRQGRRASPTSTARRPTTTPPCSSKARTACSTKVDATTPRSSRAGRPGVGQPPGRHDLRADVHRDRRQDRRRPRRQRRSRQRGHRRPEENGAGKVPVTGQDATAQGLQNILAGDQCMTVYKAVQEGGEARCPTRRSRWPRATSRRPPARSRTPRATARSRRSCWTRRDHQGQRQGRHRRRRADGRRRVHRDFAAAVHRGGHQVVPHDVGAPRHHAGARPLARSPVDRRQEGPCGSDAPPERRTPLLELRGVNKSFGAVQVLHDVRPRPSTPARSPRWSATTAPASPL